MQHDLRGGVSRPSKGAGILTEAPDVYGRLSWRKPPEKFCFWQAAQTCIREEKSLFGASWAKGIITHPNERINKVCRGVQSSGKQLIIRMQSLRLDSYTKTCQPRLTLKLLLWNWKDLLKCTKKNRFQEPGLLPPLKLDTVLRILRSDPGGLLNSIFFVLTA